MKRNGSSVRWTLTLGLTASMCWLVGCTAKRPTGSLSGKVTHNGQPLAAGVVFFSNQASGAGASVELDASGAYRIASLFTGEYQVAIQPPPPPAPHEMTDANAIPRAEIPPKYQDPKTSGLTVTVKEGASTADFAL